MKIEMLVGMAGTDFALAPGDRTERFNDGEAIRLIEAGYAMPVAEDKIERAAKKPAAEKRG
jgi:hypothetical protein